MIILSFQDGMLMQIYLAKAPVSTNLVIIALESLCKPFCLDIHLLSIIKCLLNFFPYRFQKIKPTGTIIHYSYTGFCQEKTLFLLFYFWTQCYFETMQQRWSTASTDNKHNVPTKIVVNRKVLKTLLSCNRYWGLAL